MYAQKPQQNPSLCITNFKTLIKKLKYKDNKSTKNSGDYTEIVKFYLTKTLKCVLLEK